MCERGQDPPVGKCENTRPPLTLTSTTHILSGGLESVFGGDKQRSFDVPTSSAAAADAPSTTVGAVVAAAASAADPDRADLFATGGRVRPGVLVLVNDTDWELW